MRQSGIPDLLHVVSMVVTAESAGAATMQVLEQWMTPVTAIVVRQLGALAILVAVVWWHVDRSAPPGDRGAHHQAEVV